MLSIQQRLYFLPLPQGQGSFRPGFMLYLFALFVLFVLMLRHLKKRQLKPAMPHFLAYVLQVILLSLTQWSY